MTITPEEQFINNFISERKDRYSKDGNLDIERDYNIDKAHKIGYHGREIFELLQNVDDAYQAICLNEPSKKGAFVEAFISFKNNTLTISNTGTQFTDNNIKRLCVGDASEKNDDFIGKKGTGFRSVLNWATEIRIYSGKYSISFSREYCQKKLNEWIEESNYLSKRKQQGFIDKISVFSTPKWIERKETGYDTTIEIDIDDKQNKDEYSVQKQLKFLDENILLFLPNITKITVEMEQEKKSYVKEKSKTQNQIAIIDNKGNKSVFNFFSNEGNEQKLKIKEDENTKEKKIKLAVAIPKIIDYQYLLYSFFPIRSVKSPFPVLLNASFELDGHRDAIPVNEINTSVFKELLKFYVDTICSNYCKSEYGDLALKLLLPNNFIPGFDWKFDGELGKLSCSEFYISLLKKAKIFETVNNTYISSEEKPIFFDYQFPLCFKGDVFSSLIKFNEEYNKNITYKNLIRFLCLKDIEVEVLAKKINTLQLSDEERIEVFIWWLERFQKTAVIPNLIKTSNNTSPWITIDSICFFNAEENIPNLPNWAKIVFIDPTDEVLLVNYMQKNKRELLQSFVRDNKKDPKRTKRLISRFIKKSGSFKLKEYSQKAILSPINSSIKDYTQSVEFVKFLWELSSYTPLENDIDDDEDDVVSYLFPGADNKIYKSSELYYGSNYNNTIGNILFNNTSYHEIASLSTFGIETELIDSFKYFLRKNGVKEFPEILKGTPSYLKTEYEMLLIKLCQNFREFDSVKIRYIENLNIFINNKSTEDIITWLIKGNIASYVRQKYDDQGEVLYYQKAAKTGYPNQLNSNDIPNYIRFVFTTSKWFVINNQRYSLNEVYFNTDDKTIEQYIPCINEDYLKRIGRKINCSWQEIYELLKDLGLCERLTDLKSNSFYQLLLNLKDNNEITKRIYIKIYDECIESKPFFENCLNSKKFEKDGLVLARNKTGKEELHPVTDTFFSNKAVLNLQNKFLLASRDKKGREEIFTQIFKVKSFTESYKVKNIEEHEENASFVEDFNKRILPCIVCLRIGAQDKIKCKNLNIRIVKDLEIEPDIISNIDEYSILNQNNQWFIFLKEESKLNTLQIATCLEEILNIYFNYPSDLFISRIGLLYSSKSAEYKYYLNKFEISDENLEDAKKFLFGGSKQECLRILKDKIQISDEVKELIDQLDLDYIEASDIPILKRLMNITQLSFDEISKVIPVSSHAIVKHNKDELEKYLITNNTILFFYSYLKLLNQDIKAHENLFKEARNLENKLYENENAFCNINFEAKDYVKSIGSKELTNPVTQYFDISDIYKTNINTFKNMVGEKFDSNLLENKISSLIYFENYQEALIIYNKLLDDELESNQDKNNKKATNQVEEEELELTDDLLPGEEKKHPKRRTIGNGGNGSRLPKEQNKNIITGDKAEKMVFEKIKNQGIPEINAFFNNDSFMVEWKSMAAQRDNAENKGDDSLGYDIICYQEKTGKYLYIEVKSTEGEQCCFDMPINEYKKAFDNESVYWIAFVYHIDQKAKLKIIQNWNDNDSFKKVADGYHFYFNG